MTVGEVRQRPDIAPELKAFLEQVQIKMAHFIRDVRKDGTAGTGEFAAFEVRH